MSSTDQSHERLEERVIQLEHKLEALEQGLPEDIVRKMDSHASAKEDDAREQYSIGERQHVVIEEVTDDASGRQAVSHLQGIAVFVDPHELSMAVGDTVEIKITDVKSSVIHGLALDQIDAGAVSSQA